MPTLIPAPSRDIPGLSVVMPTLNEEENLPNVFAHLPSALHEFIVVDGRSSDRTVAVAQRLRSSSTCATPPVRSRDAWRRACRDGDDVRVAVEWRVAVPRRGGSQPRPRRPRWGRMGATRGASPYPTVSTLVLAVGRLVRHKRTRSCVASAATPRARRMSHPGAVVMDPLVRAGTADGRAAPAVGTRAPPGCSTVATSCRHAAWARPPS